MEINDSLQILKDSISREILELTKFCVEILNCAGFLSLALFCLAMGRPDLMDSSIVNGADSPSSSRSSTFVLPALTAAVLFLLEACCSTVDVEGTMPDVEGTMPADVDVPFEEPGP